MKIYQIDLKLNQDFSVYIKNNVVRLTSDFAEPMLTANHIWNNKLKYFECNLDEIYDNFKLDIYQCKKEHYDIAIKHKIEYIYYYYVNKKLNIIILKKELGSLIQFATTVVEGYAEHINKDLEQFLSTIMLYK